MSYVINRELSTYWQLIFHHNSATGQWFKDEREAKLCNKKEKFSVLARIDDRYKIAGYFEFLLLYPEIDDYLQWKQELNPIHAHPSDDIGFALIHKNWENSKDFEGFTLSDSNYTYIEGQASQEQWFYSIGQYHQYEDLVNRIPGPQWTYNKVEFHEINVYMKVVDSSLIRNLYVLLNTCIYTRNIRFYMSILTLIFIKC